jgi:hypothetical protein
MEDLGVRDAAAMTHGSSAPTDLPEHLTMPAWLKEHIKSKVHLLPACSPVPAHNVLLHG